MRSFKSSTRSTPSIKDSEEMRHPAETEGSVRHLLASFEDPSRRMLAVNRYFPSKSYKTRPNSEAIDHSSLPEVPDIVFAALMVLTFTSGGKSFPERNELSERDA